MLSPGNYISVTISNTTHEATSWEDFVFWEEQNVKNTATFPVNLEKMKICFRLTTKPLI